MKKRNLLILFGLLAFIVVIGGLSYSYFVYNKDLGDVSINTGEISINYSGVSSNTSLTGIVPMADSEGKANSNYIDFTVDGIVDTDRIYYEVYILPKTGNTLSTQYIKTYLTDQNDNRINGVNLYNDLQDNENEDGKRLYRDVIETNNDKSKKTYTKDFRLRIWLDENYSEQTSKTFEFDINIYAKNVDDDFTLPKPLEEIMRKSAVMDNVRSEYVSASTGINFGAVSSDTNGKGVYMRAGTENDAYPIVYYRGAVEDNNILFNNKCWKAVRTTDTGGVKLIYNGSASANKAPLSENEYTIVTNTGNFVFDSTDNTWTRTITGSDGSSSSPLEISFKVPARENYIMQITGTTSTSGQASITIYKDTPSVNGTGNGGGGALNFSYTYGTLTADNVIKMTYYGNGTSESPTIIKIKMVYPNETMGYGCDNSGTDSQITLSGTNTFPFSGTNLYKSLAYNGYMWGEVYEVTNEATTSGAYYGTGFTWDGTNYTLTSAKVGYDGTHHYTCNLTTAEGTCSSIRYYYYTYGTSINNYVTLTGGDSIEKAIEKMQTNTNSSNAKTQIDTWYAANMSTVTSKLEDTIWCNDRSISSKAGWDPTGNVTADTLYYSPYNRVNMATPSLSCANINDAFTVSNGNGNQKLTYPVALLTSDEMTLAGGKGGSSSSSSTFYLNSGAYYWSLSPNYFYNDYAFGFRVYSNGGLYNYDVSGSDGLRPSVSLKPGMPVVSGDGTVNNPYVISSD